MASMPSSAVLANISPSRAAPSSMEYSVCTCRWTKPSEGVVIGEVPAPSEWRAEEDHGGPRSYVWGRPSAYGTTRCSRCRLTEMSHRERCHRAPTLGASGSRGPAPPVPRLDLDPGADPAPLAVGVRVPGVVAREPVDVDEARVVAHLDDAALDADVGVPAGLVQSGQRHPRVLPEVGQAPAALVHVDQDPVPARPRACRLEEVPGGDGHRLPVGAQGGDHGGVRLGEQVPDVVGKGRGGHWSPRGWVVISTGSITRTLARSPGRWLDHPGPAPSQAISRSGAFSSFSEPSVRRTTRNPCRS